MRRARPLAFAGLFVLVLVATLGFASFATEGPDVVAPEDPPPARVPEVVSGRLTAAVLSSRLTSPSEPTDLQTETPSTPSPDVPAADEGLTPPRAGTTQPPSINTDPVTTLTTMPATTTTVAPTTTRAPPTLPPITEPPTTFTDDVERWRPLVATYFPESLLDEALSVMECESRGDPNAENLFSSASGLYQFIESTWNWASTNAGFDGVSAFDPEANIATAAFLVQYSIGRGLPPWQHWVCQPSVGS